MRSASMHEIIAGSYVSLKVRSDTGHMTAGQQPFIPGTLFFFPPWPVPQVPLVTATESPVVLCIGITCIQGLHSLAGGFFSTPYSQGSVTEGGSTFLVTPLDLGLPQIIVNLGMHCRIRSS